MDGTIGWAARCSEQGAWRATAAKPRPLAPGPAARPLSGAGGAPEARAVPLDLLQQRRLPRGRAARRVHHRADPVQVDDLRSITR